MADGDLVVANHQFEVRTTLFGATTQYHVRDWGQILGHSTKDGDVSLGSDHGRFAGSDFLNGDSKVIELLVRGTSEANMHSLVDALRDVWIPGSTIPLTYRVDSTLGARRIYGRTRGLRVDFGYEFRTVARVLCEFVQTDPRTYGHTLNSTVYAVNDTTTVANAGNIASGDVTITFAATSTGAKLLHNGNSLVIDFDGKTISGSSYVVDVGDRTVLQSTTNKYGDLTAVSEIGGFELAAGSNSLTYTTDSGSGGCTVAWRDAWA